MLTNEYLKRVYEGLEKRNANEPEFLQAVREVLESIQPVVEKHPEYEKAALIERLAEPERIKQVSGALLAGKRVHFTADWPIQGTPPAGVQPAAGGCADFALTLTPTGQALHIVPRIAVLGIGCRRGTAAEHLEAAFAAFCRESGLAPQGVAAAASIDLKRDEPGLAAFCRDHGWSMDFYTAAQLRAVPGSFTASGFVTSVTGVDNVCERAAVLASGGKLLLPKWARDGVTFAAALRPFAPDWRWKTDEA